MTMVKMERRKFNFKGIRDFYLSQVKGEITIIDEVDFRKLCIPLILGPSGVGKTQLAFGLQQDLTSLLRSEGLLSDSEEVELKYFPASDLEATISQVLYDIEKKALNIIPLNLDPDKFTLLVIDEATNASPGFQGQLQTLLTSYRIGDYVFKKLFIVLLGNRLKDSHLVNDFASTNVQRVVKIEFQFDPVEMGEYLSGLISNLIYKASEKVGKFSINLPAIVSSAITHFVETNRSWLIDEVNKSSDLEGEITFSPRQFESYLRMLVREFAVHKPDSTGEVLSIVRSNAALGHGTIGINSYARFIEAIESVLSDNFTYEDLMKMKAVDVRDKVLTEPSFMNVIATAIATHNYDEKLSHAKKALKTFVDNIYKAKDLEFQDKVNIICNLFNKLKSILSGDFEKLKPVADNILNTLLDDVIRLMNDGGETSENIDFVQNVIANTLASLG